jgi:glycosyltransferase involved in cell wall biosynthesis
MKVCAYAQLHRGAVMPTGVGQHLIHMIRGLWQHPGMDVEILAPRSQLDREEKIPEGNPLAGIAVRGLPFGRRCLEAMWQRANLPKADRWCGDADWIYSPTEVYIAARRPRLAVTVHDLHAFETHLPWSNTREHQAFRRRWSRMMKPIIGHAACILAVSEFTKDRLCKLLEVKPDRVAVVGNGVDPQYFDAPRGLYPDSGNNPYIVVVGGLTRRKGGDLVLRVARILARECPELRILVAGRGEAAFAPAALAIGNIRLLQHIPTVQLASLLQDATSAIFLSRYEGFGMPVIEAMAAGTPVISSNCGALPEVVGAAGCLLDPEDTGAVVEAIKWLSNDAPARAEYVARGRLRARSFRWEQCVERLVGALNSH